MHNPIDILDINAASIARSLDIMVLSTESLYEKFVREDPSVRGMKTFWFHANQVRLNAVDLAIEKLLDGRSALSESLSDSERVHVERNDDTETFNLVAREALNSFMSQVQTIYAKRFRDIIAARAFNTDTYNPNPKVITGSGRKWNFTDFAYITARQLLVDWYNTSKLSYLIDNGHEEFFLLTRDPELMTETYRVDEYPEIADKLFHPRTTKLIGGPNVST